MPFKGYCKAIVMENKNENELLINEYNMSIPVALIGLIEIWHSFEYVHVIKYDDGCHWKINVDKIMKSN